MASITYKATEVVSTENMDEETWLKYRKNGIGGSDLAAIMGVSPFATARDLYYDKCGIEPMLDEESNWVAKKVGHLLEDLVAEIFAKKTGFKVWSVKTIFSHPDHPFMQANVDFFYEDNNGKVGGLECKTTNYMAKSKWDGDTVPLNYELQCRHYMAIMDIDEWWIACMYGNNENDFIMRKINRDEDYEDVIIQEESTFWNDFVLAKQEPAYTENGDLILASIKKHYGNANSSEPRVTLHKDYAKKIERILELKERQKFHDKESRLIKREITSLYAPIADELGTSTLGDCIAPTGIYAIDYKATQRIGINKDELNKLKINHKDIYDEYVTVTESRTFNVKKEG
ncbi:MAG: YqaJ viral recombinase family protein [Clostridia bacterium]